MEIYNNPSNTKHATQQFIDLCAHDALSLGIAHQIINQAKQDYKDASGADKACSRINITNHNEPTLGVEMYLDGTPLPVPGVVDQNNFMSSTINIEVLSKPPYIKTGTARFHHWVTNRK